MGFLDKVKEQAATATAVAKDAKEKGQSKLDELSAKRAADGLLRDLGTLTYASATDRASGTAEADAQRIVDMLKAHEAEHGALSLEVTVP